MRCVRRCIKSLTLGTSSFTLSTGRVGVKVGVKVVRVGVVVVVKIWRLPRRFGEGSKNLEVMVIVKVKGDCSEDLEEAVKIRRWRWLRWGR